MYIYFTFKSGEYHPCNKFGVFNWDDITVDFEITLEHFAYKSNKITHRNRI